MLWDTHMHSHYSGDSAALPESMIRAAMEKNLDGICFTDHLDYDYKDEPDLFLLDIAAYQSGIRALQERYDGVFPVLWGIEIGLQPHVAEQNRLAAASWPFDLVIGSSHVVHGHDPYYGEFFEGRTAGEAYREYFESVLENIRTDADYDVYGHLDYIVRYAPDRGRSYSYEAFSDIIDEILRALIARSKGLELNTGNFQYGISQPNPCAKILKRYRELGGEILTIGADAHRPEDVAHSFAYVPELLEQTGFRYYTVYEARRPIFRKLPNT